MEGAERGTNRSPRNIQMNRVGRKIKPEETAHDGFVSSRIPKRPVQGITSHSAAEGSARQERMPRAGLNHSK